jgi:hypothetical protein
LNIKKLTNNQKKGIAVVAGVGVAAGIIYYLQKAMTPKADELLTDGGIFGGGITPGGIVIPEFKEEKLIPQDNLFPNGGGGNGNKGYTPPPNGGGPPPIKGEAFPSLPKQFPGLSELPLWPGAGGGPSPFIDTANRAYITPPTYTAVGPGAGSASGILGSNYLPQAMKQVSSDPIVNLMRWSGTQLWKGPAALGQTIVKQVTGMFIPPSEVTVPLMALGMGSVTIKNPFQPQVKQKAAYGFVAPPQNVAQIPSFSLRGSPTAIIPATAGPNFWGTGIAL